MTKYIYKGIEVEVDEESERDKKDQSSMPVSRKLSDLSESNNEINHEDHHHHHHTSNPDKIDGKEIHLVKTQSGKYLSHYYPYVIYDTKLEVAKTLIDYVPEFGGKELKNKGNETEA